MIAVGWQAHERGIACTRTDRHNHWIRQTQRQHQRKPSSAIMRRLRAFRLILLPTPAFFKASTTSWHILFIMLGEHRIGSKVPGSAALPHATCETASTIPDMRRMSVAVGNQATKMSPRATEATSTNVQTGLVCFVFRRSVAT